MLKYYSGTDILDQLIKLYLGGTKFSIHCVGRKQWNKCIQKSCQMHKSATDFLSIQLFRTQLFTNP